MPESSGTKRITIHTDGSCDGNPANIQTVLPTPCLVLWPNAPVGAYCTFEHEGKVVTAVKISSDAGRCLITGRAVQVTNGEQLPVAWFPLPQWHVRCHEAGHLVFGLDLGTEIYREDGIMFNPWDGSGVETGSWRNKDPKCVIRLSLAGVLTQLQLAPDSFHPAILPTLRKSVVIDDDDPIREGLPTEQIPSNGGASYDFKTATMSAVQLCGSEVPSVVNTVLREQEALAKQTVNSLKFQARVRYVADDVLAWLREEQGLRDWESAFRFQTMAFYTNARALAVLAKA